MYNFRKKKKLEFFSILLTGLIQKHICKNCFFLPGLMPINFSREEYNKIKQKNYRLLEKSDGVRFILIIGSQSSYFISRKLSIQKMPKKQKKYEEKKKGTVLDGEMSFNLIKEDYEYLIHDVLCFRGDWRISTWDLIGRINILKELILKKTNKEILQKKNLKKKDFFEKSNIEILFDKIHTNFFLSECIYLNYIQDKNFLCNKNDGIIFAPSKKVYSTKFPTFIFKWKYENGNSIDFIRKDSKEKKSTTKNSIFRKRLYCIIYGNKRFLIKNLQSNLFFEKYCCSFSKKNYERIEEYIFEKKKGKWVYIKKRTDKKQANSGKVLIKTLENIAESFLQKELVDKIFKQNLRKSRGKIFF